MAAVYAGRVSQVGSPQRRAQQPAEKGAAALAADAALAVEAAEAAEAGGSGGSEGGEGGGSILYAHQDQECRIEHLCQAGPPCLDSLRSAKDFVDGAPARRRAAGL